MVSLDSLSALLRTFQSKAEMAMRLGEFGFEFNGLLEGADRFRKMVDFIEGTAEFESEGQLITLGQGDSWVVPRGARHRYRIIDEFLAVEATSPPAQVHGRDQPPSRA